MTRLQRSGQYWKVGDLDKQTGLLASEPFLQKNPKGDEIYYIEVQIDTEKRLWGMSWSAFNALCEELGEESEDWVNRKVRFATERVKTKRGEIPALIAHVVTSTQTQMRQETTVPRQDDAVTHQHTSPTQQTQPHRQAIEYACPSMCGFRTHSIADLGAHTATCPKIKEMEDELPSHRR